MNNGLVSALNTMVKDVTREEIECSLKCQDTIRRFVTIWSAGRRHNVDYGQVIREPYEIVTLLRVITRGCYGEDVYRDRCYYTRHLRLPANIIVGIVETDKYVTTYVMITCY